MGVKDNFIYEKCKNALDATFKKELEDCSEKMIEISEECKTYYKNKFESESKNNEEKTNSENPLRKWKWRTVY